MPTKKRHIELPNAVSNAVYTHITRTKCIVCLFVCAPCMGSEHNLRLNFFSWYKRTHPSSSSHALEFLLFLLFRLLSCFQRRAAINDIATELASVWVCGGHLSQRKINGTKKTHEQIKWSANSVICHTMGVCGIFLFLLLPLQHISWLCVECTMCPTFKWIGINFSAIDFSLHITVQPSANEATWHIFHYDICPFIILFSFVRVSLSFYLLSLQT